MAESHQPSERRNKITAKSKREVRLSICQYEQEMDLLSQIEPMCEKTLQITMLELFVNLFLHYNH